MRDRTRSDGGGNETPRQRARAERAQAFALEEALFLAQRRAREAEEAMVTYDARLLPAAPSLAPPLGPKSFLAPKTSLRSFFPDCPSPAPPCHPTE